MIRGIALFVMLGTLVAAAEPDKPKRRPWGEWTVEGDGCRSDTVQAVQNGDDLSVLFSSFGITMPAGQKGDGLEARKDCHFKIFLVAPEGMELSGVSQTYSGGMIKSKKAKARLGLRYHVGEIIGRELPLVWAKGEAVPPESPNSIFAMQSETEFDRQGCAKKSVYHIRINLTGDRPDMNEFLIGGVDSLDTHFKHRVQVNARFKPCR